MTEWGQIYLWTRILAILIGVAVAVIIKYYKRRSD